MSDWVYRVDGWDLNLWLSDDPADLGWVVSAYPYDVEGEWRFLSSGGQPRH